MNKTTLVMALSALALTACQPQAPVDQAVNDGCLHYSPAQTVLVGKTYSKDVTAPGKMTLVVKAMSRARPSHSGSIAVRSSAVKA